MKNSYVNIFYVVCDVTKSDIAVNSITSKPTSMQHNTLVLLYWTEMFLT